MTSAIDSAAYDRSRYSDDDYRSAFDDDLLGERIGPPLASRRTRLARRFAVLMILGAGGAYAYLGDHGDWPKHIATKAVALLTTMKPREAAKPPAAAPPLPVVEPITEAKAALAAPPVPPSAVAAPDPAPAGSIVTGALPPEAPPDADAPPAKPEPLPPPSVDRSDPYQVKAAGIGLHPGLSHALLSRLTDADYKNAAKAIATALTETDDGAVFTWPIKPKADQAQFEVHFVPGATPECRRYVVTVSKDKWATTAFPMERCGVKRAAAKPKANAG